VQLEAHQAGTPVVSTNLPSGVPFVNPDGVTGLIVPPGDPAALADALTRILRDDALRERMGATARQRVLDEFSVDAMVRRTIEVYREAIDAHDGQVK
jgi:rhamnosyl/mannosyltransferase